MRLLYAERCCRSGGLKEKLLAALRGGIEIVLIPEQNTPELVEIPSNIKQHLDIRPGAVDRPGMGTGAATNTTAVEGEGKGANRRRRRVGEGKRTQQKIDALSLKWKSYRYRCEICIAPITQDT